MRLVYLLCLLLICGLSRRAAGEAPEALRLPTEWLTDVKDLTEGFGGGERDAYYMALDRARGLTPAEARSAAAETRREAEANFRADPKNARKKFSLYYELVRNPAKYRGRLVTLTGYIRTLETMEAGENEQGLETLHQANLFAEEAFGNPCVIVCSEIPHDLRAPKEGSPTDNITVTGYFYKLWSYEAPGRRWAAPLILAGQLEWNPRPPGWTERPGFKNAITIFLALLGLGAVYLVVQANRKKVRPSPGALSKTMNETLLGEAQANESESLAALRELENRDRNTNER
jgi:hypothetical protein